MNSLFYLHVQLYESVLSTLNAWQPWMNIPGRGTSLPHEQTYVVTSKKDISVKTTTTALLPNTADETALTSIEDSLPSPELILQQL